MSDDLYPEHTKLAAIANKSQACGEFVDWLEGHGYHLCQASVTDNHYWPTHTSIQELLAAFFDIDRTAVENEKRAMLDAMREVTE